MAEEMKESRTICFRQLRAEELVELGRPGTKVAAAAAV